jgi:two-component system, sporulation sensor kinase E
LKVKKFLDFSYESHIRVSLIFFILFLILLNFGTISLFHQTQEALREELDRELYSAAFCAKMVWEKSTQTDLKRYLAKLTFELNLNRIEFLDSNGERLISSEEAPSGPGSHIFRELRPEEISRIKANLSTGQTGWFTSNLYGDKDGNSFRSAFLPVESQRSLTDPFQQNKIWVMVEKDVTALGTIQKLSKLNSLARTVGLLLAGLVALFFIKSVLRPYRLMIKKAREEKITSGLEKRSKEGGADVAVKIFEQVIAELKKNEATLQKLYAETNRKAKDLESYNEYILRSIGSGMIICDSKGRITGLNDSAQRILGLCEKDAAGKGYQAVFREKTVLCSLIQTALSEKRVCSVPEMEISQTDGENIWVGITTSVVKDEQDQMLGVVLLLTDVTEIKRLQHEVAFKEKMAALGEMSSGLAHELRNSIGAVLGFAKLLKKGGADPESTREIVDGVLNEAMSVESLIQRFLTFAKPFHLKTEKIDVKSVVDECIRILEEKIKKNRIELELKSQPNLLMVRGDRLLLRQSFQNLIQNSIEAMPTGGKLSIELRETQPYHQERLIKVEISDTGCGMEEKNLDKIFNPFFTCKEKGTGLGLSLVKKIISLHNGRIEFESRLDKGTTFRIYLLPESKLNSPERKAAEEKNLGQFVHS